MLECKRSSRNVAAALVLAVSLLGLAPGPANAGTERDAGQASREAGLGVATVFANLFYIPVKVGYAAVGGLTGGVAYLVTGGNRGVAESIWIPSLGGDYVLGPSHISGEETVNFSGLRNLPADSDMDAAEPELSEDGAYDDAAYGDGSYDDGSYGDDGSMSESNF